MVGHVPGQKYIISLKYVEFALYLATHTCNVWWPVCSAGQSGWKVKLVTITYALFTVEVKMRLAYVNIVWHRQVCIRDGPKFGECQTSAECHNLTFGPSLVCIQHWHLPHCMDSCSMVHSCLHTLHGQSPGTGVGLRWQPIAQGNKEAEQLMHNNCTILQ